MYTKEDFNKDFEQIKETLKNIDFTKVATEGKENIKLATDEFKNLYNKITDLLANKQISNEEFNEYKNTLLNYFKGFNSEELLNNINEGLKNVIEGAKTVISDAKDALSSFFKK